MKKQILMELIWIIGVLIVSQIVFLFFQSNSALDINLHDTYTVNANQIAGSYMSLFYYRFAWFITFGFGVYFFRASFSGFKIAVVLLICLVFTGLGLYFLDRILFVVNPPAFSVTSVPSEPVKDLFYGGTIHYHNTWIGSILKLFLIGVLTFISFMTGKYLKRKAD